MDRVSSTGLTSTNDPVVTARSGSWLRFAILTISLSLRSPLPSLEQVETIRLALPLSPGTSNRGVNRKVFSF